MRFPRATLLWLGCCLQIHAFLPSQPIASTKVATSSITTQFALYPFAKQKSKSDSNQQDSGDVNNNDDNKHGAVRTQDGSEVANDKDTTSDPDGNRDTADQTQEPLLDWKASGSIGNLLMQMQKHELQHQSVGDNSTTFDAPWGAKSDESIGDVTSRIIWNDHNNNNNNSDKRPPTTPGGDQEVVTELLKVPPPSPAAAIVDDEEADKGSSMPTPEDEHPTKRRGLFRRVFQRKGRQSNNNAKTITEQGDIQTNLNDEGLEFQTFPNKPTTLNVNLEQDVIDDDTAFDAGDGTAAPTVLPPPSDSPYYYKLWLRRDRRKLTISVATTIESAEQWRMFCEQKPGYGVVPLLECIQDGANHIRRTTSLLGQIRNPRMQQLDSNNNKDDTTDAILETTAYAFRALRNLCGVSPELAAIITDTILRANEGLINTTPATRQPPFLRSQTQQQHTLLEDMMLILQYAHKQTAPTPPLLEQVLSNKRRQKRRDTISSCKLYVTQLLLAISVASDNAVDMLCETEDMLDTVLELSSYSEKNKKLDDSDNDDSDNSHSKKGLFQRFRRNVETPSSSSPSSSDAGAGTALPSKLDSKCEIAANQILAAMGYNHWVPKVPGQRGLRILSLDGGGARGMASVTAVKSMVDATGGMEISDSFDMVVGTSTGAIIAFLLGLRRETGDEVVQRYNDLLQKVFTKSALSLPMMLFTTASYDESHFMDVMNEILGDGTMLDTRGDPKVPYVFAVSSKMLSIPTHVALFRNYNYSGREVTDPFTIDPDVAREELGLGLDLEDHRIRSSAYPRRPSQSGDSGIAPTVKGANGGSRNPGSFRVLQRYALRASTAAPTVFKPVMMGGEMYCDGGIVSSNPTAVAIHEARSLFPDVPIELVVSMGTGAFTEAKSNPRIGWDGIIGQIVDSACDGEQVHHVLEDVLGDSATTNLGQTVSGTRYFRFNPVVGPPDSFPIDVTDPKKLQSLKTITINYMEAPEQQAKLKEITNILKGRRRFLP